MRRVFFSFHYENDAWRVQNVMNSQVVDSGYEKNRFLTAQDWETVKRRGDDSIKRWIEEQMRGASVLCVLIGSQTASRRWVKFEMEHAKSEGMGLLGVFIHQIKDQNGETSSKGLNPFETVLGFSPPSGELSYPCASYYDWDSHDGRENIGAWIEKAAQQAGR